MSGLYIIRKATLNAVFSLLPAFFLYQILNFGYFGDSLKSNNSYSLSESPFSDLSDNNNALGLDSKDLLYYYEFSSSSKINFKFIFLLSFLLLIYPFYSINRNDSRAPPYF